MEEMDERDRLINQLVARVWALERLVTEDLAQRWTGPQVKAWCDKVMAHNDDTASPTELGRAFHTNALHGLAAKLEKESRRKYSG